MMPRQILISEIVFNRTRGIRRGRGPGRPGHDAASRMLKRGRDLPMLFMAEKGKLCPVALLRGAGRCCGQLQPDGRHQQAPGAAGGVPVLIRNPDRFADGPAGGRDCSHPGGGSGGVSPAVPGLRHYQMHQGDPEAVRVLLATLEAERTWICWRFRTAPARW